jgi:acetyl-CoA C-acetyltransferase
MFGGALAYGHPYGVSGAMILLHLLKALEKTKGKYGLCSVAAAGGIGSAILIERE